METMPLNLRKKGGNSLIRKGMTKSNKNFLLISENINNPNGVNENSELLNSNLLTRIKNVFNFYCKEKSNVNTENSSFLVSFFFLLTFFTFAFIICSALRMDLFEAMLLFSKTVKAKLVKSLPNSRCSRGNFFENNERVFSL